MLCRWCCSCSSVAGVLHRITQPYHLLHLLNLALKTMACTRREALLLYHYCLFSTRIYLALLQRNEWSNPFQALKFETMSSDSETEVEFSACCLCVIYAVSSYFLFIFCKCILYIWSLALNKHIIFIYFKIYLNLGLSANLINLLRCSVALGLKGDCIVEVLESVQCV